MILRAGLFWVNFLNFLNFLDFWGCGARQEVREKALFLTWSVDRA